MNKIGKYLRELSIVVLGVAITLSAGVLINNWNEKRNIDIYLKAIKIELEENMKAIDNWTKYMQDGARYEKYVSSHDNQPLNEDTLTYYAKNICYDLIKFEIRTNAFDVFRNSGAMYLLNDKELVLSIYDSYQIFDRLNEVLLLYYEKKQENVLKELPILRKKGRWLLDAEDYKKLNYDVPVPMYNFYILHFSSDMINSKKNLAPVKATLAKLKSEEE